MFKSRYEELREKSKSKTPLFFLRSNKKKMEQELEDLNQRKEVIGKEISNLQNELEKIRQEKKETVEELEGNVKKIEEKRNEFAKIDGEKRELFIKNISDDIVRINEAFKEETTVEIAQMDELMRQFQTEMKNIMDSAIKKMDTNMKNAINQMVDIKRKIEGADFEDLLDNYSSLQESIYYNYSEKELGLHPTKITAYLNRFLRVIKTLGYECFIPKVGEEFDEYYHEEVDAREICVDEEEAEKKRQTDGCIVEVVSYGFIKDNFCVKRAKVTIGKSNL